MALQLKQVSWAETFIDIPLQLAWPPCDVMNVLSQTAAAAVRLVTIRRVSPGVVRVSSQAYKTVLETLASETCLIHRKLAARLSQASALLCSRLCMKPPLLAW